METESKISNVEQFLKSLYLGDRACEGYSFDPGQKEFKIRIDEISRVRSPDGLWNFYNDENVVGGSLSFSGVEYVRFDPPGLVPNDYVEVLEVQPEEGDLLRFRIELGCVGEDALTTATVLEIIASDVFVESPDKPGTKIR